MTTLLRRLLRVALGALLLGTLVLQTQLPMLAEQLGGRYWETADLVQPYAAAGIVALACLAGGVAVAVGGRTLWSLHRTPPAGRAEPAPAR